MNLSQILFLSLIIVVILLIKYFMKGKNHDPFKDNRRPSLELKPTIEVENDKQILMEGVSVDDISKVITDFCNAYNKESYCAIVQINQLENHSILLTFPYDMDFVTYCFFVNYLYFPFEVEYSPVIKAWATVPEEGEWSIENIAGRKVFLFLPEDTNEYDKVYIVTEDNFACKIDFGGFRNPVSEVKNTSFSYFAPPVGRSKELYFSIIS